MLLSVVMPVYNEKNTIEEIIQKVLQEKTAKELIIVDDCSADGTRDFLDQFQHDQVRIFFHEKNQGKGAAIRTGLQHVAGDIVIIQDADLEYDPEDYARLIKPIVMDKADVVYGSRFRGVEQRVLYFWHYVGNKFLTLLSNMLTNLNLSDMETCYKAFRTDVIKKITIEAHRFGMEPEVTAKVAKLGCRVYEVPISYYGRDYSEGKKITWRDGISAIYFIFKFHLFR
ncbi:MAG: glycosyltransferase family 2 protein [Candidatus Omnitrophota bacterium]|jgi:glycosyltransferase involved in cell wall biosynthesis|nr:MAG: glycosyltransferase family 2 protein [Candidatus Omnitrophota bacterium]